MNISLGPFQRMQQLGQGDGIWVLETHHWVEEDGKRQLTNFLFPLPVPYFSFSPIFCISGLSRLQQQGPDMLCLGTARPCRKYRQPVSPSCPPKSLPRCGPRRGPGFLHRPCEFFSPNYTVYQESTNFFWEGPESKHFGFCRPHDLSELVFFALTLYKQPQKIRIKREWLCPNKTLFTRTDGRSNSAYGPCLQSQNFISHLCGRTSSVIQCSQIKAHVMGLCHMCHTLLTSLGSVHT